MAQADAAIRLFEPHSIDGRGETNVDGEEVPLFARSHPPDDARQGSEDLIGRRHPGRRTIDAERLLGGERHERPLIVGAGRTAGKNGREPRDRIHAAVGQGGMGAAAVSHHRNLAFANAFDFDALGRGHILDGAPYDGVGTGRHGVGSRTAVEGDDGPFRDARLHRAAEQALFAVAQGKLRIGCE